MTDDALNEALAEKLDLWIRVKIGETDHGDIMGYESPDFLHDWSAMGILIAAINGCLHLKQQGRQGKWEAEFCGHPGGLAHGDTAPEAVAKAAALVLGIEDKGGSDANEN